MEGGVSIERHSKRPPAALYISVPLGSARHPCPGHPSPSIHIASHPIASHRIPSHPIPSPIPSQSTVCILVLCHQWSPRYPVARLRWGVCVQVFALRGVEKRAERAVAASSPRKMTLQAHISHFRFYFFYFFIFCFFIFSSFFRTFSTPTIVEMMILLKYSSPS